MESALNLNSGKFFGFEFFGGTQPLILTLIMNANATRCRGSPKPVVVLICETDLKLDL